ncbi:MAG TPA: hypothetical protein VFL80_04115, partial [Thermoanaerobaculia bacterium]|nr:hypothetical protein [Thermoanaerobaculia bacterium]
MSRISNWCAVLLLTASTAFGGHEKQEIKYVLDVSHNLAYRGGKVSVDHKFGKIVVRTHSGRTVLVKGAIRSSSPEFGRQIRVSATESGNGVTVKTGYPSTKKINHLSFSVDYDITVPEKASLDLHNRFGPVDVSGVKGASEISNAHGSVVTRN